MSEIALRKYPMTESGVVLDEPAYYGGWVLGRSDIVNDPTCAVCDNNVAVDNADYLSPILECSASDKAYNGHHPSHVVIADKGVFFYMDENGGTHTAVVYARPVSEVEAKRNNIV